MPVEQEPIELIWILVATALVMLMQVGFCCLESGLVRSKSSVNVAIKNLVDFCLSAIIFWLFGYAIMFGASHSGLFGTSNFMFGQDASPGGLAFFIFQLVFCGTTVTILSGAVAERMRFSGYLVVSAVVAAIDLLPNS